MGFIASSWSAFAQETSTVDLVDFVPTTPDARFDYTGLYVIGHLGAQATATSTVVSNLPAGDENHVRERLVFTVNGSSLTLTTDVGYSGDSLRTLREEASTSTGGQVLKFTAWPQQLPRVLALGAIASIEEVFTIPDGRSVTRSGTGRIVGVENVDTALGTFNCIHLRTAVDEVESTTGPRSWRSMPAPRSRGS
jgi:hypothetical protein